MDYNYITDDIRKVVDKMNYYLAQLKQQKKDIPCSEVYYLSGTKIDIANQILNKMTDPDTKYSQYPLVMLRLPTAEDFKSGLVNDGLNLAIVMETDLNLSTKERLEQNFKHTLFPLYALFIKAVKSVGIFVWEGDLDSIPHQKIVRPHWGTSQTEDQSEEEKFPDPLDAIEIVDLKINQTINNRIV